MKRNLIVLFYTLISFFIIAKFLSGQRFEFDILAPNFVAEPSNLRIQLSQSFKKIFPEELNKDFVWPYQVKPGQSLNLFSMDQSKSKISVVRVNPGPENTVAQFLPKDNNNKYESCSYDRGCDWTSVYELKVKENWRSGVYQVRRENDSNSSINGALFLVYDVKPANVLFVYDWMTLGAYNLYAGASVYFNLYSDKVNSPRYPLNLRPYPSEFSLRRPYSGFSMGEQNNLERRSFEPMSWWLNTISKYNTVNIIANTRLDELSVNQLLEYPVIFLGYSQEYVSYELLDRLQSYVTGGGYLVIGGSEFAYRVNRFSERKESFFRYTNLNEDPFLNKDKSHLANDTALTRANEDFFGASFNPEIGFSLEDNFKFKLNIVKYESPIFDKIDRSQINMLSIHGWNLGSRIKINSGDQYCILNSKNKCLNVSLFAFAKADTELHPPNCCESHKFWRRLLSPQGSSLVAPKTLYAPIMEVRQGKGHILILPFLDLQREGLIEQQFWKNIWLMAQQKIGTRP